MPEPQKRQLVAILFADITGYTALMQADEQKALGMLKRFKAELESSVATYDGEIIQFYGDGCLVTFGTAVNAVRCSMVLQEVYMSEPEVPVRVGIHMGDVVYSDDNAFGDSINIASRIESMGIPGAILFSEEIRNQVHNQRDLNYTALGAFEFKNVEEPKTVYALTNTGFNVPDKGSLVGKFKEQQKDDRGAIFLKAIGALALFAIAIFLFKLIALPPKTAETVVRSLAIFPFENQEDDQDIAYLSDGIPENLINRLAMLDNIKVFSRSATFAIRDKAHNTQEVRQLLGADAIFTGQITRHGNQLVLKCQLVDARTNTQIWGDRIKHSSSDVFRLEDSLVNLLLDPLRLQLQQTGDRSISPVDVDPAAYAEYMRGRYLSYGSTTEEAERSLDHFREAIRIEPNYAQAYAAIAYEKIVQALFSTATREEIFNEARIAVQSAIGIDPNLAEAYRSDGAIKFYGDWDFDGADQSYKKALELNPNDASNYIRYSATLVAIGNFDKAIQLANKAVELDPVSISSLHNLG